MTANTTSLALRLCLIAGFFLATGYQSPTASAAVIYDESVDGDLPFFSSQGPVPVLTLRNGVNEVRGNTGTSLEFDRFDIRIASGAQLTGISVSIVPATGTVLSNAWAITNSANHLLFNQSLSVPIIDQPLLTSLLPLGPGTYHFSDNALSYRASPASADYEFTFTVVNGPGVSQSSPVLPSSTSDSGVFSFSNVSSGLWCDPPLVSGFHYEMTTPGSLFTGITGFPTGFSDPFTVFANGVSLGQFLPGQTLTFAGSGVTSFDITGISPLADAASPTAFPLQLTFSTPTASFTMQGIEPTPVPTTFAIWIGSAFLGLAAGTRNAIGQRVRIIRGLLTGLIGTIQDLTASRHYVLEIDGLPTGVQIIVAGEVLEFDAQSRQPTITHCD